MRIVVNGRSHEVEVREDTPLLWVLREELGLMGAKYGCGAGHCGACTVLVDGAAVRSCLTRLASVVDSSVTTIEGVAEEDDLGVVEAWVELDVAQCGYCQPGQVMAATALLRRNRSPTDAEILDAMRGNLCRCGTYPRILRAVRAASARMRAADE